MAHGVGEHESYDLVFIDADKASAAAAPARRQPLAPTPRPLAPPLPREPEDRAARDLTLSRCSVLTACPPPPSSSSSRPQNGYDAYYETALQLLRPGGVVRAAAPRRAPPRTAARTRMFAAGKRCASVRTRASWP